LKYTRVITLSGLLVASSTVLTQSTGGAQAGPSSAPFEPIVCDPETLKTQDLKMRVRLSTGVLSRLVRKRKLPDARDLRKQLNQEQRVKVGILFNHQGDVACAQLREGLPLLAERSLAAVREWKFKPYSIQGRPFAVESTIEFFYKGSKVKSVP
jgi:hypothetical protein